MMKTQQTNIQATLTRLSQESQDIDDERGNRAVAEAGGRLVKDLVRMEVNNLISQVDQVEKMRQESRALSNPQQKIEKLRQANQKLQEIEGHLSKLQSSVTPEELRRWCGTELYAKYEEYCKNKIPTLKNLLPSSVQAGTQAGAFFSAAANPAKTTPASNAPKPSDDSSASRPAGLSPNALPFSPF